MTFGQKVPKLNSRPVYCSRLYGMWEKFIKIDKPVGWNKHVGEIFNTRVDKEGSRMERTLDFDSFDLGVNF